MNKQHHYLDPEQASSAAVFIASYRTNVLAFVLSGHSVSWVSFFISPSFNLLRTWEA